MNKLQRIILWFIDLWITIKMRWHGYLASRSVIASTSAMKSQHTAVIGASAGDLNVTPAVLEFYRHNEVISCFRMQQWLKRHGIITNQLVDYTMRDGTMYHSRVDLENNKEINADVDIDDLNPHTLTSRVVVL